MSETTSNPLVTVLLPVHNGSKYLTQALASIFAQTFRDYELLVIDDGSTDRTPDILRAIRDPRLRVVTHAKNLGLVATLNEALEIGRGMFIARQDHDDLSYPERLQKQVDFLQAHPDHVLVGTEATQIDAEGRESFRLFRPDNAASVRWYLCFENAFIHSSVMYRREIVWRDFEGYATPCFPAEDYALWSRMARERAMANLPEPLLLYREHGASAWGGLSTEKINAMDAITCGIRRENLQALLGAEYSTQHQATLAEWARELSVYRRNLTAEAGARFLEIFEGLIALKLTANGGGSGDVPVEYRRILGVQYADHAYRVLQVNRWMAVSLFRRACGYYPELKRLLPWPRIAALFLLGDGARKIYRAIFGGG